MNIHHGHPDMQGNSIPFLRHLPVENTINVAFRDGLAGCLGGDLAANRSAAHKLHILAGHRLRHCQTVTLW